MMGGILDGKKCGENPSPLEEGGTNTLSSLAYHLQHLKYNLQDQTDFAFHDIVPLFRNIVIEEEISPIILLDFAIKKKRV